MITRYITSVTTSFCPFNARSGKTARSFLASLPPGARRDGMKIDVKVLPRSGIEQPAVLDLTFKDGKQMKFDIETVKIVDVQREVDRHSRGLSRQEQLAG